MSSPTVCRLPRPSCPCFIPPLLSVYDANIKIWNAPQKGFCNNLIKTAKLIAYFVLFVLSTFVICLFAIPMACCSKKKIVNMHDAEKVRIRESRENRAADQLFDTAKGNFNRLGSSFADESDTSSETSSEGNSPTSSFSLDESSGGYKRSAITARASVPVGQPDVPTMLSSLSSSSALTAGAITATGSEMSSKELLDKSLERTTKRLYELCAGLQQDCTAYATISLNYADKQQAYTFTVLSHGKNLIELRPTDRNFNLLSLQTTIEYINDVFAFTLRNFSAGIVSTGLAFIYSPGNNKNVHTIVTEVLKLGSDDPLQECLSVSNENLLDRVSSHPNIPVRILAPHIKTTRE